MGRESRCTDSLTERTVWKTRLWELLYGGVGGMSLGESSGEAAEFTFWHSVLGDVPDYTGTPTSSKLYVYREISSQGHLKAILR